MLVAEDDATIRAGLDSALADSGYRVMTCEDGATALRESASADLLVVDVMMPIMNGFELVRRYRAGGGRAPVLSLTARDALSDRVKGLDLGGDDYLAKPFRLEELLARVRALLRRADSSYVVRGELRLDLRSRRAWRAGRELGLTETEFRLLLAILEREGAADKRSLLREVWADDGYRDENVVEVYVGYLRTKLEAGGESRNLHTIRGKGYVFS